MSIALKKTLFEACQNYVGQRISNAQQAVEEAQQSANAETKSTAGDKHDTARAMMQLAAEQNARHLEQAQKLQQVLHLIDPEKKHSSAGLGSLVTTNNGYFFMAVSIGKLDVDGNTYFVISPGSPIGQALMGLKVGDKTAFNQKSFEIKAIY